MSLSLTASALALYLFTNALFVLLGKKRDRQAIALRLTYFIGGQAGQWGGSEIFVRYLDPLHRRIVSIDGHGDTVTQKVGQGMFR